MAGRLWYDKQPEQQQPDIPPPPPPPSPLQKQQQNATRGDNIITIQQEEEEDNKEEEEDDAKENRPLCDSRPFRNPTVRREFTSSSSYQASSESSGSLGSVSVSLFCSSPPHPQFRVPGRAQRLLTGGKKYLQPIPDHFPTRKALFKRQRRPEEKFFRRSHFSYESQLKLKKNKPNSAKLFLGRKVRKSPSCVSASKPLLVTANRRADFTEDKSRLHQNALPLNRHLAWRVASADGPRQAWRVGPADAPVTVSCSAWRRGPADALRPCTIGATVANHRPVAHYSPRRTDTTTTALGSDHVVLQPLSQKVVYAADCVSGGHQGTGMASRSSHNLPSTITTTTTTTTTSTISSNTSKNVACATTTSNSSQQQQQHHHSHHKHNNHHHHHHHRQRHHDYQYPQDHHQAHQPHTINPATIAGGVGGGQQYTSHHQSSKSQQQYHHHQQQQCCSQGIVMPPACLSQYYPSRIALPDGEERTHHTTGHGRHTKDKVSEIKRPYIKPPANKSLFDMPLSSDINQLPCQLSAAAHYCNPHLQASPTPAPPLSPTQPTLSRQHKHQSRDKEGGRAGGAPLSPQPTRKPKNLFTNYIATLSSSSPKNRKESNLRKASQQNNSGYSNSNSSSCSSNSSTSSSNANSCCNSTNYKIFLGISSGRDRVRGSSTAGGVHSGIPPSERDHLQGYSTLSSSLPSPELPAIETSLRDSYTTSMLTDRTTDGLSPSISCPSGPSSVSEVTLLACNTSSMNTCSHSPCIISNQKVAIQYQQQHYQQPQYLQPQYHDLRPHSPNPPCLEAHHTSPPHYHKLSYHHHHQQQLQHNPLTSSISSSPPASPSCPSPPPTTSPEQYEEELSGLPSRGEVTAPLSGSSQYPQEDLPVCSLLGPASREVRSCSSRPSSLTSDEMLLQSQQPPSYREVLEHPDRFREPPPSYSTSSSSTNRRNSIISLTSVPCDNDSIEAVGCISPDCATTTTGDTDTSRSRGGLEYGVQEQRQRCCDSSRSRDADSAPSSEGDDEEDPEQDLHTVSQRQHSLSSSREALYGSCTEKNVI